ncbi:MAG: gliding motility-associated C-terminal domain-containing protein, partial [Mucilaginibacter sp.]
PAPVFTFDYPDKLQYCDGTPITLKPVGSANYQYRWYKDGQLTGDITPSLAITQSGKYKVEVSACSGSWLGSKEVEVNFVKLPTAVIITNKPAYCIGDNATLSTTPLADPFYTINWYKDNVLITENKNLTSFSTNIAGSYTVSIVNNTANSDGSICSQASELLPLVFNPPPTVSIEQIINNTLCDGQTIFLKANHTSGTAKWSTGETSDQISVTQSGNYKVTVTSPAGCTVDANMNVTFFANPVLSIANTSICAYTQKMITLSAPGGFAKYEWNGTTGNEAYDVHSPQTVSLTVTDAHGCQTTQQIIVTDQCPDIHIPNTFTPNGDLINDTWDIKGLQDDPTALVQVFTRYGNKIFESRGYPKPWDGENQGKKLPTGTYYYIITAKKDTQTFSGYVAIIY